MGWMTGHDRWSLGENLTFWCIFVPLGIIPGGGYVLTAGVWFYLRVIGGDRHWNESTLQEGLRVKREREGHLCDCRACRRDRLSYTD